jgi:beta-glucanase (GH16 family)
MLKVASSIALAVLLFSLCADYPSEADLKRPLASPDSTWTLVWADECNGDSGTAVDNTKWSFETGGSGWGNNELENYTNRIDNSYYDGKGNLVIKTMLENLGGKNYTSARLVTRNTATWTYCRVDIRAKLPTGRCVWPAFWMMPTSMQYGGWPRCGEIDIMEERGDIPNRISSTIHFGNPWKFLSQQYTLSNKQNYCDGYHNFGLEWEAGKIRFYVDDNLLNEMDSTQWYTSGATKAAKPDAPFDQNFYLIINTAVGGPGSGYTGNLEPDNSVYPQYMHIDYVRVYKKKVS